MVDPRTRSETYDAREMAWRLADDALHEAHGVPGMPFRCSPEEAREMDRAMAAWRKALVALADAGDEDACEALDADDDVEAAEEALSRIRRRLLPS